ncbi:MAG: MMPL family transporter [Steroidobacteraceae bacterium]
MNGGIRAAAWLGLWLLALLLLSGTVAQSLRLGSDLRLFLPGAGTPEQQLVLDGIGEGPASRMLLIALSGADRPALAALSQRLVDGLRGNPAFLRVDNGSADTAPDFVTEYRYLLSPAMDRRPLDAATLKQALANRLQDLASPAAPVLEPLIPADPTLEVLAIAESWAARRAPQHIGGVWFDAAGRRTLLVAQTHAGGFDPDGQQHALAALDAAFLAARTEETMRMTISGPGRFSALMKERTQREATWLGSAATAGLLLLLFVAYRRPRVLLLAALPIASAALAGLASVSLVYGDVHAITLAFGFTLIGVAQDYPIHLLSHQRRGLAPLANASALWRTLATGVVSTCVAYLAFLASGVTGLAQLACFTIVGLAVAGLSTRYLLPRIIGEDFADTADGARLVRAERRLSLPAPPLALQFGIVAICVAAMLLAPGPFWENDLGALTPVPRELLEQDADLRGEIGAPDVRYLAVITAATTEHALQRLEAVTPGLESLVGTGDIAGFDHAARYLPSQSRQRQRQQRLPAAEGLEAALTVAQQDLPFRTGVFSPFMADVARARTLPPLDPAALGDSALSSLLEGFLRPRDGGIAALVAFSGVANPQALERWVATAGDDATVIDLKRESIELVVRQRERILLCLAIAVLMLTLVVRTSLGDWRRVARVLAPMMLTTLAVVAVLRVAGVALDLFHLISLVLAAGLGLDYALFFERAGADRDERLRTLHGILVCALSTWMVFLLLSLSSIPVLQSIGVTVSLGVFLNFLLALAMSRSDAQAGRARG